MYNQILISILLQSIVPINWTEVQKLIGMLQMLFFNVWLSVRPSKYFHCPPGCVRLWSNLSDWGRVIFVSRYRGRFPLLYRTNHSRLLCDAWHRRHFAKIGTKLESWIYSVNDVWFRSPHTFYGRLPPQHRLNDKLTCRRELSGQMQAMYTGVDRTAFTLSDNHQIIIHGNLSKPLLL